MRRTTAVAAALAALCALASAADAAPPLDARSTDACEPRQLHFHPVPGAPSSLLLRWTADEAGCGPLLSYGADGEDGGDGATAPTPYLETTYAAADMCASPAVDAAFSPPRLYGVTLTGLTPGRRHWFSFSADGDDRRADTRRRDPPRRRFFRVPPAPSPTANITFAVFGDMGEPDHPGHKCAGAAAVAASVAADVAAHTVDAVLHVGDVAYADGVPAAWDRYEAGMEAAVAAVPLAVAAGNHEAADARGECGVPLAARYGPMHAWRTSLAAANEGGAPWSGDGAAGPVAPDAAWPVPPAFASAPPFWYGFEAGPVAVTVLSSEHPFAPGTPQFAWAQDRLHSINRCATPWSIVAIHRPLYVPFPHKANRAAGAVLRAALEPLFIAARVDAVVAGHVHCYARSCPVAAKVCASTDDCDDVAAASSSSAAGITHWTLGTGGRRLSGVDGLHKQPHWVEAALAEWGHLRLAAVGGEALTAEFVGAESGRVLDRAVVGGRGWAAACAEGASVA